MTSWSAMWWGRRHPPEDPTNLSFACKTVLVTGANSGLGHEAAVKYAALGASTLILGIRTQEKGEQAKQDIAQRTKGSPNIFVIETVDLSTFASLAAGILQWEYVKSLEVYEMTLQVSVLSKALMALLLLPKLRETAAASQDDSFIPHMSFLHSIASFKVTESWLDPGKPLIQRCDSLEKWVNTKQYFLIKLASWFFIQGLVDRCKKKDGDGGNKVVINANCPGPSKTNMTRNFPPIPWLIMNIQ